MFHTSLYNVSFCIVAFLLVLSGCTPKNHPLFSQIDLSGEGFSTQAETHLSTLAIPPHRPPRRTLSSPLLRGINYYPQHTPWEKFWPEYDTTVIQADLKRIHEMGFNTVRIFVYYTDFGGPEVAPMMKGRLLNFLQQAQAHQLQVVVTLFDQYQDYHHIDNARAHLAQLTEGLAQHPAIAAWDLKSESDRDYAYHGEATVKHWLMNMQQFLHTKVEQPLTASYANALNMDDEVNALDYLTFHYYADERNFSKTLHTLRQRFPDHALVLGEFGYHTWQNHPSDPHPQAHQYNYFQAILAAAQEHQLKGIMAWSLYDYPVIAGSTFLAEMSHEQHMGLWRLDNTVKPGYLALQQPVFLVDAETGTAVTPLTREIKAVFTLKEAETVRLSLKQMDTGTSTDWMSLKAKQGLNTWQWRVSDETLQGLLTLKYRLQFQSQNVLPLFPSVQTQLTLRLD